MANMTRDVTLSPAVTIAMSPSSDEIYVPAVVKTITMVLYCVVSMVGVFGNILTIASISLHRKLKSIPNVYIANLAVADLIVCSIIAPFSAYISVEGAQAIPHTLCTFIGALNAGVLGVTIFSLTAIGVNRFILIVKGTVTYTTLYTRRNVIVSLVCVWLVAVLMILPGLLGFGEFGYNSMMGTCIFRSHDTMTYIYVQTILHGVCVGPCVVITIVCYSFIIFHFRKSRSRIQMSTSRNSDVLSKSSPQARKVKMGKTCGVDCASTDESPKVEEYDLSSSGPSNNNSTANSVNGNINQARMIRRARSSRRVVVNLCTVFTVFLFCWMPIVTVYTVDYSSRSPAAVSHIFYAIAVSNSCLNVFIYAGMNMAFRKSYKNILTLNFERIKFSF